jgi:hypothetical protein
VKFGKSRQIVANETADPRTSDQGSSTDGCHFSGTSPRWLARLGEDAEQTAQR